MSWILQIDTALETAIVSLSNEGRLFGEKINGSQKDHAAFLHSAIADLVKEAGILLNELKAVSVVAGPGSYTGLRVGFATAKGLCFALKIPLITIGTLEYMAASGLQQLREINNYGTMLVCPMIDARRMEVYTALYDGEMNVQLEPQALILDAGSLSDWLLKYEIYFFGTGCAKWRSISDSKNANFPEINNNSLILSALTNNKYQQNIFEAVAYSEPVYLKEFYFK